MRWRIAALTLALGLGLTGIVCADESSNWLTRWFTPAAPKTEKIDAPKVDAARMRMPPAVSTIRAKQAASDKERRDAVCLKLREIAIAAGDEDMLRKVEQLEQRVWDVYVAGANQRNPQVTDPIKKEAR